MATLLLKADTSDLLDDAEAFQGYVISRAYLPGGSIVQQGETRDPLLIARAQPGVTLQVTVIRDLGLQQQSSTESLAAGGTETRVTKKFADTALADAVCAQYKIGDASAVQSQWSLDELYVQNKDEGEA